MRVTNRLLRGIGWKFRVKIPQKFPFHFRFFYIRKCLKLRVLELFPFFAIPPSKAEHRTLNAERFEEGTQELMKETCSNPIPEFMSSFLNSLDVGRSALDFQRFQLTPSQALVKPSREALNQLACDNLRDFQPQAVKPSQANFFYTSQTYLQPRSGLT